MAFDRRDFARKMGAAQARMMTDLAVHILTASPEELDREEEEWDAAHPEAVADRERFRAEQEMWAQARAEGRVRHRYYPPPHPLEQDGRLIKDHWGYVEEWIEGTGLTRQIDPYAYAEEQKKRVEGGVVHG